MDAIHIAILTESPNVDLRELNRVVAAISKQVNFDFFPIWKIPAVISTYGASEDVPPNSYRVVVVSHSILIDGREVMGAHRGKDKSGNPFALVSDKGDHWSHTLSHEILEMLVDPTLEQYRPGKWAGHDVSFLVEICDPCQGIPYDIDGVAVSSFITPRYFDEQKHDNTDYSWRGSIDEPLTCAPGGYLVWRADEDGPFKGEHVAIDSNGGITYLGKFQGGMMTAREWVDSVLRKPTIKLSKNVKKKLRHSRNHHKRLCTKHARAWRSANRCTE
ncbi:hypothetical protein ACFQ3P_25785 [Paraburkholderia sabiae]|uniref:Uncharacterized protein n=1 Tax=Paraburkholderia sabiae TaxID=273251 RepID=A0ABU9QMX4_9BURK|nr:hypothetical protein [Paraburkholderia sabiae]WJZ77325.1 hypothetical protein QEN71_35220 [Paraburkholderia sabiae]CAD6547852.1 hypothetical protein LMG24235_04494 [Paraburkholderia sabiae]